MANDLNDRFLTATRMYNQGNSLLSIQLFRELAIDYPNNPEVFHNLALVLASSGHWQEGLDVIEKIMASWPGFSLVEKAVDQIFKITRGRMFQDFINGGASSACALGDRIARIRKHDPDVACLYNLSLANIHHKSSSSISSGASRKLNICIGTSFNENFNEIGSICVDTIKTYAYRHGYQYRVGKISDTERPPAWYKIPFIVNLLNESFDFVMWIDSDALFVNFDVDIMQEVLDDRHLYLASHRYVRSDFAGMYVCYDMPNTGVMLIRNCKWSRDLLTTAWNMEKYINFRYWDNAAILDIMGYHYCLDQGCNNINQDVIRHVKIISTRWNVIPDLFNTEYPIIKHYAGFQTSMRKIRMEDDYNKLSISHREN